MSYTCAYDDHQAKHIKSRGETTGRTGTPHTSPVPSCSTLDPHKHCPPKLLLHHPHLALCPPSVSALAHALMYVLTSICSGSSVISTSNLLCTCSSIALSSALDTNVMPRPLVPNLPLLPTL